MTEAGRSQSGMPEERRDVLRSLVGLLSTIGSANDAEDHGYREDAERMRNDSCEAIRGLMAEHPFLAEFFPKLQGELDTQHILGFGWAELYDGVDAHLKT
jgi:hypothetical protein